MEVGIYVIKGWYNVIYEYVFQIQSTYQFICYTSFSISELATPTVNVSFYKRKNQVSSFNCTNPIYTTHFANEYIKRKVQRCIYKESLAPT